MTKLTHYDLYTLGKLLGYQLSEMGLCHGVSLMLTQAFLAEDEQYFFDRLHFIASYKPHFVQLKKDIQKAKKKIQSVIEPIGEQNEKLLEVLAFFDGIELYLKPNEHLDLFEESTSQEDINKVYSFLSPEKLKDTKLTHLLNRPYAFDKKNLNNYLSNLANIFKDTNASPPIILRNIHHTVCFKYNKNGGTWLYVDTNDFDDPENNSYFRNLNTEELANSIFKSFDSEERPHVVINIEILTNQENSALEAQLDNFQAQHPITAEQATIHDHLNTGLLVLACRHRNLKIVQDLLRQPNILINTKTQKGETPLLIACAQGYIEIVQELIAHPDTAVNESNLKRQSPLSFACAKRHAEIVQALLQHSEILVNEPSEAGEAPLHLACQYEDETTVQALLEHELIKVNQIIDDENKKFPLYIACEYGTENIVLKLLKHDDILVNQGNAEGITSLCVASYQSLVNIVWELLQKSDIKINQPTDAGNTPLHYACSSSESTENQYVIQLLLEHGASLTAKNEEGKTAIDIAFASSNELALYLLLEFTLKNKLYPEKVMSVDTFEELDKEWLEENLPGFMDYVYQAGQEKASSSGVSRHSFFIPTVESDGINDNTYNNTINNTMEKK